MGDPCWEYFVADMAGLAVGAITYGIYTTCSPAEVRHQLENAGAKIFIAENQEYVDKVLDLQNLSDRDLCRIIVAELRGDVPLSRRAHCQLWQACRSSRRDLSKTQPQLFEQRTCAAVKTLMTGRCFRPTRPVPSVFRKAAMIVYPPQPDGRDGQYLSAGLPSPEPESAGQRHITHLPLAHLVERSMQFVSYVHLLRDAAHRRRGA